LLLAIVNIEISQHWLYSTFLSHECKKEKQPAVYFYARIYAPSIFPDCTCAILVKCNEWEFNGEVALLSNPLVGNIHSNGSSGVLLRGGGGDWTRAQLDRPHATRCSLGCWCHHNNSCPRYSGSLGRELKRCGQIRLLAWLWKLVVMAFSTTVSKTLQLLSVSCFPVGTFLCLTDLCIIKPCVCIPVVLTVHWITICFDNGTRCCTSDIVKATLSSSQQQTTLPIQTHIDNWWSICLSLLPLTFWNVISDQGHEGEVGLLVWRRQEHGNVGGATGPRHPHLGGSPDLAPFHPAHVIHTC